MKEGRRQGTLERVFEDVKSRAKDIKKTVTEKQAAYAASKGRGCKVEPEGRCLQGSVTICESGIERIGSMGTYKGYAKKIERFCEGEDVISMKEAWEKLKKYRRALYDWARDTEERERKVLVKERIQSVVNRNFFRSQMEKLRDSYVRMAEIKYDKETGRPLLIYEEFMSLLKEKNKDLYFWVTRQYAPNRQAQAKKIIEAMQDECRVLEVR